MSDNRNPETVASNDTRLKPGQPGYLFGAVEGVADVTYAESALLRLLAELRKANTDREAARRYEAFDLFRMTVEDTLDGHKPGSLDLVEDPERFVLASLVARWIEAYRPWHYRSNENNEQKPQGETPNA